MLKKMNGGEFIMNRKRRVTIALASAFLISTVNGALNVNAAGKGDVNADGKFDSSDIVWFARYMLGEKIDPVNLSEADINGDGRVNISDYILAKSSLLGEPSSEIRTDIHLEDNGIIVDGSNASVTDSKTVIINASGSYYIDGKLSDGQICVDIPDQTADPGTVKLFFNGVDITGVSEAPVYIKNAENTSVNLVSGTENYLYDGQTYTDTTAVIYAKDDLTIKGEGKLEIHAGTQYGIHCNNDLKINGANILVATDTEDAIRGKSSVCVKSGTVTVDSKGDGIKSTKGNVDISGGTVIIKAGNDAIQAETTVNISDGKVSACGDKGLTSLEGVNITGGSVLATATDEQCQTLKETGNGVILLEYTEELSKNNSVSFVKSDIVSVFEMNTLKKFKYVLAAGSELAPDSGYSLYTGGKLMTSSTGNVFTAGTPSSYTGVSSASDNI